MQANVGLLDRYIRLVSGLLIFGSGVGLRRGSPLARGTLLSIGAMKIAEGVTGWCPVMHACGIRSNEQQQQGEGSRQQNGAQHQGAGHQGQAQQQASHQQQGAGHQGQAQQQGSHQQQGAGHQGQAQQQGSGEHGQVQQHYQSQAPAPNAPGNNYSQQQAQSGEGGQRRKASGNSRRTHKRDDNQATEAVAASLQ